MRSLIDAALVWLSPYEYQICNSVCLHQMSAWRDPRGTRPVTRGTIVTRTQVEIIAGNSPSFGDESNQNHKFITHLDRGQHQVWLWHSIRTQLNNFYLRESRLCKMSGSFNNPFMSGCDQSQMPVDVIVYRYRQHPTSWKLFRCGDDRVPKFSWWFFFWKQMHQLCFRVQGCYCSLLQ